MDQWNIEFFAMSDYVDNKHTIAYIFIHFAELYWAKLFSNTVCVKYNFDCDMISVLSNFSFTKVYIPLFFIFIFMTTFSSYRKHVLQIFFQSLFLDFLMVSVCFSSYRIMACGSKSFRIKVFVNIYHAYKLLLAD